MSDWYKITSATLWGNTVEICIYPSGCDTSQQPVALKAASEPFEMETDDSTDIDTTIRETTGTVRFIVEDAGVLEAIIPDAPFDTLVVVTCAGTVKFKGFVEVTDYTQAWDGTPYEFELPVQGRLSLMDKLNVQPNDDTEFAIERNFAYYLRDAFRDMYVAAGGVAHDVYDMTLAAYNVFPSSVVLVAGNFANPSQMILSQMIQREWFLEETTEDDDEGYSVAYMKGCTWKEAFSKVLLPYSMDMWIESDTLYMRSQYPSQYFYNIAWSYIETNWADGGSISQGSTGVGTKTGVENWFSNMSDGNSIGWVQPYCRINVTRKLEKTELFELSETFCGPWTLRVGKFSTDSDYNSFMLGQTVSSQRGLNLRVRQYSYGTYSDIDQEDVELRANSTTGRDVYPIGAIIADMQTWEKSENNTKQSLDSFSPQIYLLCGDGELSTWAFMVTSPVVIYPQRYGAICINAKLKYYKCTTSGLITGDQRNPGGRSVLQYKAILVNLKTDDYYQYYRNAWSYLGTSLTESSNEKWTGIIFEDDTSGDIRPNTEGYYDEGLTDIVGGTNRPRKYGHSVVELGTLLKYDGAEGFVIPLKDITSPMSSDAPHKLMITVCTLGYGYSHIDDGDTGNIGVLEDFKVNFAPQKIDGSLTTDGSSQTSQYAKYIPLNTEKCMVYEASGDEYGEEADITLDSWDDEFTGDITLTGKDNRTVQPSMPVWHDGSNMDVVVSGSSYEYHTGRFQWAKKRKLLTLDDARALTETPWAYWYREEEKLYRLVASGWKASNEGGKKVFIEIV
ncbi:MAG: hypothetical protein LUI09_05685 [Prevotellaceae bacterium]|nr:hypothetical protein [Prevotellaceae bacterium]